MVELSPQEDADQLVARYKEKLESGLSGQHYVEKPRVTTREYQEFKSEYMPKHMSFYEKGCQIAQKAFRLKADKKKVVELEEAINICHLAVTPDGTVSFALMVGLSIILLGSLFSFLLFQSFFFVFFSFFVGLVFMAILQHLPYMLSNNWRMKTSNQMVQCIFYVVTHMRHTSNLEIAIDFAADHLSPPLSLDLKKVLWDVETEKYESVKESLGAYLETWRKWNLEFIEAFHLIEGSLFEGSEDRRLSLLDKSLSVMLDETYEKMLHYAHNLKSPITMLHMLGVIMPILGLVILPLVVSFMEGIEWYHLAALYNFTLPFGVYYLGKSILSSRPTGYGDTDIAEENPNLKKYRNIIIPIGRTEIQISPLIVAAMIAVVFFIIGISPILMHVINPTGDLVWGKISGTTGIHPISELTNPNAIFYLLGYREKKNDPDVLLGPYGIGAALLSLGLVLSAGLSIGVYFKLRSKNVIEIRNKSKELEKEFASAIFQLGNKMGDGIPAEMAFGKVADNMRGSISGKFFSLVSQNINRLGMSVEQAIFDNKHGALAYYPSNLIESSMKVLVESSKKGSMVAAQALLNISRYIKQIHKVNERLKDLMADVISSMNSQIKFLAPVIAGIVIGITSMVTAILGRLSLQMQNITGVGGQLGGAGGLGQMFSQGIPTYFFQIIVGFYVVQIIYILTLLANGIENGADKLFERYQLGNNMFRGVLIYTFVAFAIMILFNMIAANIMKQTVGSLILSLI